MILVARILFICIFAFVLVSSAFAADLVVTNGKIWTGSGQQEFVQAMAVSGERISAVGTNEEIKKQITETTKLVDAGGKTIIPGFNDAHVHFMTIGFWFFSIDFKDAAKAQDVLDLIERHAKILPEGTWIRGVNLDSEKFRSGEISLDDIDRVTLRHPVFIYSKDINYAVVNANAAKIAGLKPGMKGYGTDPAGNFSRLISAFALERTKRFLPAGAERDLPAILQAASNYAASLGVTSVQDVHSDELFDVYADLEKRGMLKTRVYDCIELRRYEKLATLRSTKMVRNGCLKGFADGDEESFERLKDVVSKADKAKLQVMVHAIGAKANDVVLRVFERVDKQNGRRDRRFRIEHAHNVLSRDIIRLKLTGTIASMQPHLFGNYGEPDQYFAMFSQGVKVAFGSDAPMREFDPILGIHDAVNGIDGIKHLTVAESLGAYTFESAFAEFQETEKGEIKVGKLADFVILSDDIFTIDKKQIKNIKVIETYVGGRSVYKFN